MEFEAKSIQLYDKTYRLQIWDTAGQETFKSITRTYYKNSACAVLVYDISRKESFENLKSWLEECKTNSQRNIVIVLIGNKYDLGDKREISTEEGRKFAEENDLIFFECSAKTGHNVESAFTAAAEKIVTKINSGEYDLVSGVIKLNLELWSKNGHRS